MLRATDLAGVDLYNLACVFSRASESEAAKKNALAGERDRLAEERADQAVSLLERARNVGLFNEPSMTRQAEIDPDLTALRTRDDFQSLMAGLKK
jgi:hypothetical protein